MYRLIRLLRVFALFTGLALACAAITLATLILSVIAFSGSTGQAFTDFWKSIEPFFMFAFGAVTAGGIASLVNALVTSRGVWFWPITLFSIFGGAATVLSPPVAHSLTQLAMPAINIVGKTMLADKGRSEALEERLTQFIRTNQILVADIGPVKKTRLVAYTKYKSGAPNRYEVAVSGERQVYAIVDDNRQGKEEFRLRCTTTIALGHRDPHKDPCEQ